MMTTFDHFDQIGHIDRICSADIMRRCVYVMMNQGVMAWV
jgi:hypothetical protein